MYKVDVQKLISFKDTLVVNHPLLNFSIELEKILKILQLADNNFETTIKKYFNNDGEISICYKDKNSGSNRFKFIIKFHYQVVMDDVIIIINYGNHFIDNKKSIYLYHFIVDNFKNYIEERWLGAALIIPKSEIDNFVQKLQEIKTEFSAIKYNL